MGKWTEAALRAKPFFQKGAQTLTGNDALAIKGIYPTWEELLDENHEYHKVKKGFKFTHADKLYQTEQPEYTFTNVYIPGTVGTESLFSVIDETHAGTLDNPIPYEGNMVLENGKYYSQNGVTYLCIRDTVNPVYHELSALVGLYVEEVS